MISIDDFKKIEMKVGEVVAAGAVEESEKLIKLTVKLAGEEQITVFTGVRKWYEPDFFIGKHFVFVTNLEPRKMMGEESQGMITAVDGPDGRPVFLSTMEQVAPGAGVR